MKHTRQEKIAYWHWYMSGVPKTSVNYIKYHDMTEKDFDYISDTMVGAGIRATLAFQRLRKVLGI